MSAADDLVNAFNGVQGDGRTALSWRPVYIRSRTILSNILKKVPFSWPGGSPSSTSVFDYLQGTAEQVAWRYVDQYGNVWDQKALNLVLIEWLLDGAPTPLTLDKVAKYRTNADTLRPWPSGFIGAFPGEPQAVYNPFPPAGSK